jgi:hypothetical protein
MMYGHFLFQPGEWLGAGQVTFSNFTDLLYFRAFWSIVQQDEEEDFQCTQTVEIIQGNRMVNRFSVMPHLQENGFEIILSNESLGVFEGTGVVDERLVAWEFRHQGLFEGFEVYERVSEDEYGMKAEYLASDFMRTIITGKIWKRK